MGRHQTVQYWSSNSQTPIQKSTNSPTTQVSNSQSIRAGDNFLVRLIQAHPFAFLSGAWVVVLVMAALAVNGLTSPGPIEQTPTTPVNVQTPVTPESSNISHQGNKIPVWSLGAIALACAAGSLTISQRLQQSKLQQSKRPRKVAKRLKPYPAAKALPPSKQRQLPGAVASGALSLPPGHRKAAPMATKAAAITVTTEPVVTVLPAEQSHPLDWGDANLADMMDLRKQQPLSSLF